MRVPGAGLVDAMEDVAARAMGDFEEHRDFFVSYTSADRAWAEWIAWQLEAAGYTTTIQAWDFRPGSDFMATMHEAYLAADRLVAVLSPAYLDSRYARQEWRAALADDPEGQLGKLIPVRVAAVEPEGLDRTRVYIDLVDLDEVAAAAALVAGVEKGRNKPARSPAFPGAASVAGSIPSASPGFPGRRPVFRMPPRNRNFTGRNGDVEAIRSRATGTPGVPVVQALHGLGGVGKTELAVEYAYRHAADYDVVWWVPCQLPGQAEGALASLAPELGLTPRSTEAHTVTLVAEELGRRSRWLMIFDYAERPEDLAPYRPRSGDGHVVVTSRNPAWGGVAEPVPVEPLDRRDAIDFLIRRIGAAPTADVTGWATELAEELGDLPLALEQAAAYMERRDMSLDRYLDLFRSRREQLWARSEATASGASLTTTWTLAFDQVAAASPRAAELLHVLAFLAPAPTPLDLLTEGAEALTEPLRETVLDVLDLEDALGVLVGYSLVDRAKSDLRVHRLVQAVIRASLDDERRSALVASVVRMLATAFPVRPHRAETWKWCAQLLPHVLVVTQHAEERSVEVERAFDVLRRAGVYLASHVKLAAAETVLERAASIAEMWGGSSHPAVADVLGVLGNVLRELGRLPEALAHLERALTIVEEAFGYDDPRIVPALSNLGIALRRSGNLRQAKVVLERALSIARTVDDDAPRLASVLSDLGCVLWDTGDLRTATACFREAFEIDVATYGPDHPEVSTSLTYLGGVLRDAGDLDGGRVLLERALAIEERTYPPPHPKISSRLNNLASTVRRQGDLDRARELLERALAIDEEVYGSDHFEVATVLNQLAIVRRRQGEPAEARRLLERALAIDEATLGPDHLRVATRCSNLGDALRDLGEMPAARDHYRRAVAIYDAGYGAESQSSNVVRAKLARVSPLDRLPRQPVRR